MGLFISPEPSQNTTATSSQWNRMQVKQDKLAPGLKTSQLPKNSKDRN
jgi:hypothetical protein